MAHDGKSFHALRRTAATRLIESGAGLPLAAQILGHARIDSSRRYFALASEQLRQCCLPLEEFACIKEGLLPTLRTALEREAAKHVGPVVHNDQVSAA